MHIRPRARARARVCVCVYLRFIYHTFVWFWSYAFVLRKLDSALFLFPPKQTPVHTDKRDFDQAILLLVQSAERTRK